jgi:molybdenum cofactor cytidylyltransferase
MDAIILAAGASSRMGTDKALLPWGKTTVIEHLVAGLSVRARAIYIVTGNNHTRLSTMFPNLCVFNPLWEEGMFSSIRCGFSNITDNDPVLLQMVDQPHVPGCVYDALLSAYRPGTFAVQPRYNQDGKWKPGHPLLFGSEISSELSNPSYKTLRDIIQNNRNDIVYVDAPVEILEDMDTPEQYREITARHLSENNR